MDTKKIFETIFGTAPTDEQLAEFIDAYNTWADAAGFAQELEGIFPDEAWQAITQSQETYRGFLQDIEGLLNPPTTSELAAEALKREKPPKGASKEALRSTYENYLRDTGQLPPKSTDPADKAAYIQAVNEYFDDFWDGSVAKQLSFTVEEFNAELRAEKIDLNEKRVVQDAREIRAYREEFNKTWARLVQEHPFLAALTPKQATDLKEALSIDYAQARFADPLTLTMEELNQLEGVRPGEPRLRQIPSAEDVILGSIENGTAELYLQEAFQRRETFNDAFARLAPSLRAQGMKDEDVLAVKQRMAQDYSQQLQIGRTQLTPAQFITSSFQRTTGEVAATTQEAAVRQAQTRAIAATEVSGRPQDVTQIIGGPPAPTVRETPQELQEGLAAAERTREDVEDVEDILPEDIQAVEQQRTLTGHRVALGSLARGTAGARVSFEPAEQFTEFRRQAAGESGDFAAFLARQFPSQESPGFRGLREEFAQGQSSEKPGFGEFLSKRLGELKRPEEEKRQQQVQRGFKAQAFRTFTVRPGA